MARIKNGEPKKRVKKRKINWHLVREIYSPMVYEHVLCRRCKAKILTNTTTTEETQTECQESPSSSLTRAVPVLPVELLPKVVMDDLLSELLDTPEQLATLNE